MDEAALDLLKTAARYGAVLDIGEDDQLIVSPAAVVPASLREKLFASEPECVNVLRIRRSAAAFDDFVRVARLADDAGARYALLPALGGGAELAIFSTKAPLPPHVLI
jgi:hypothetical protein